MTYRSRRSSCYVTLCDVEFSCDYDYTPAWEGGANSMEAPTGAEVDNLTINFGGFEFTDLLDDLVVDRIIERIVEQEEDE